MEVKPTSPMLNLLSILAANLKDADTPLAYKELRQGFIKAELDDAIVTALNAGLIVTKNSTEGSVIYLITEKGINFLKTNAPNWKVKKPHIHTRIVVYDSKIHF